MSALHNAHPMVGFFAGVFSRGEAGDGPSRLGRLWNRLLTWRNRAMMRRHLLGMNDYMLKDIGLTRADAQREANKPCWED